MPAPIADRLPLVRDLHGDVVIDEYAWLREKNEATLAYLEAENAHTASETAHLDALRQKIFEEIKGRVLETDLSARARRDDWWYASRTEEGSQYPIFVRMQGAPDGPEQVLLDVNQLAEDDDYVQLGTFSVSRDHRLLAYSVDRDGSERFEMRVRVLATGEDLPDRIPDTYYTSAWSSDGRYLFYTTMDGAHRPDRIWRHEIGGEHDEEVLHESDDRMFLSLRHTSDRRFILVEAGSQMTADVLYLPADDPTGRFQPIIPRVHGVEYSADHKDGAWLVVTTAHAPNGRLISVPLDRSGDQPTELIPHHPERRVNRVRAFDRHVVVQGRRDGLTSLVVRPDGGEQWAVEFDEPVYSAGLDANLEYRTTTARIGYQSLVTPRRIIDVDLETGVQTLVKETPVLGGYRPDDYRSHRMWAIASDGARIPISVVHRHDVTTPAPVLLYGYGSYEIPMDPWFSPARLSLLDRGVVFAIAHVRGGGELGRAWYENGKLADKANTFTDFIACAEHLIGEGLTTPDLLAARGGSAGGLLMGAVANLRPELFRAIVAEVPFVDVVNTMLDASLPLTVIEWEEWGNPAEPDQYSWIRRYAPYENVATDVEYPAMLVTTGLNDPRVAFWEPAKWVAKLRAHACTRGPLLLKTDMGSGHGGPSGRYDAWRDEAFVLAFLLDRWGLTGPEDVET